MKFSASFAVRRGIPTRRVREWASRTTSRMSLLFGGLLASGLGCGRTTVHELPTGSTQGLVPWPQQVAASPMERGFRSDGTVRLAWPDGWEMAAVTSWLDGAGISWTRVPMEGRDADWIWQVGADSLGQEGYALVVHEDRVHVTSATAEGGFRGWTTLRQLMPAACESGCPQGFVLPTVAINDAPYLQHRGLLLDCCRHFMEVSFVKAMIDALALQKMNVLHWHVTEDQGWRIPIEAYPKLTEVGGYRTEVDNEVTGGHYTREDIEDVVRYAAERHVQVIPEIEMPGHCRAALAAYPWLGCTGDSLPVPTNWGVFKDVYCPGNDSTLAFMKAVLDEVCDMFPSPVIHIGGDEVPRVRWESCPKCQARMVEQGLDDESQLQTYFINEMGAHLATRGRRIMGWDEILEGGLPEGAMVQSWRGMEGAVEATHLGTDAVVSPTSHCYLDYPLRSTDLEEVYAFQPVPDAAMGHAGRIVGGECNMWTERAPQPLVMGKVFPRATGLAEVLWSGPAVTQQMGSYDRFLDRLDALNERWARLGVEPGLEGVPVTLEVAPGMQGTVLATAHPALRGVSGTVRFSPDAAASEAGGKGGVGREEVVAAQVGESLEVRGLGTVEVDVAMRGRSTGVRERFPVAGHAGAHQPVALSYIPSPHYTGGGGQALADGRRGSLDFRDGAWQAVQGEDMVCTVDLGEVQVLDRLATQHYLYQDAWIFMPREVRWSVSMDGKRFVPLESQSPWGDALVMDGRQTVVPLALDVGGVETRYVRMEAVNPGPCPSWHDAASEPTWLFVDEVVIDAHVR